MRRWVYGGAALVLAISFLVLNRAAREVAELPVELDGNIPAVIYEPGPQRFFAGPPEREAKLPVVVLTHGFAANKGTVGMLARQLVRAGYAVLAFDMSGHGKNPNPFPGEIGGGRELHENVDAAVLWASTQDHLDPERIAFAGHSMGGMVMLEYASRNPGVSAVVAISAALEPSGPYTPPNALLIFASGDDEFTREGARAAGAKFAGLDRVVLDRTYGEPDRGTGVRVSEVAGVGHATILYSDVMVERVSAWLMETLGPGDPPVDEADGRLIWSCLALIAFLVLFSGLLERLQPLVPRIELPADAPLRGLAILSGALVAALMLMSGVDYLTLSGPFGWLGILVAAELLGCLGLAGLLMLLALGPGRIRLEGLLDARVWAAALVLLALSYIVYGTFWGPFTDRWIPLFRVPAVLMATALVFPFFAASEWLLRGPGIAGVWAPIVGKLLAVFIVGAGAAVSLIPPVVAFVGLVLFIPVLVVVEILAWRLSRTTPNPWLSALFQSGFTASTVGSLFPYMG